MQLAALVAILLASSWLHPVQAQGQVPQSSAPRLDPAFAAMLLISAESSAVDSGLNTTPSLDAPITRDERLTVRRGRWLIGTGIGLAAGAAVAGFTIGRPSYCEYHEYDINKTAPRITSATLGAVGLIIAGVGGLRFTSVTEERRSRTPAGTGQKIGIALASVGLSLLSVGIVGVSALPGAVGCWTT